MTVPRLGRWRLGGAVWLRSRESPSTRSPEPRGRGLANYEPSGVLPGPVRLSKMDDVRDALPRVLRAIADPDGIAPRRLSI